MRQGLFAEISRLSKRWRMIAPVDGRRSPVADRRGTCDVSALPWCTLRQVFRFPLARQKIRRLFFKIFVEQSEFDAALCTSRRGRAARRLIGFSSSRASKIGYRHPPDRPGSKDTESADFVSVQPCSGVTGTLFPRRLQKRLLLPKGFQNRVWTPSNSLYSRSYSQYTVPPLPATVPRQPAGEHRCGTP